LSTAGAAASAREEGATRNQFGTFGGVFTPSILTILGVIMFMRAGFVVGRAGIGSALLILLLSTSITLLTSLSISAIATNTRMRGGGAYFMISRVLGPEFGGAIGLALFLAQALSVPFYILGFVESLVRAFPALEPHFFTLSVGTACVLFVVTAVGAGWAIRVQYVILAVLALAVVTFLGGAAWRFKASQFRANWGPAEGLDFWRIFAIYFPAVTGIMAGVNMSGDLKEPGKSIPRGTLLAIAAGFAVYASQILLCGGAQTREGLVEAPFRTLLDQTLVGASFLVVAGVFAATLSSAIGSFMGAPRVMQALARDGIFRPLRPFGVGTRRGDEPRRALLLTFGLTLLVLWYAGSDTGGGPLNVVAVIVTMFFLYTYGMTNLAAFVESFGLNPSFRPRFRFFHWSAALAGTVGCGAAAFLIHPPAALGAMLVVGALYLYVRSRVLRAAFGDARRGFLYARARSNLLKLQRLAPHPKNWRPTVLALTGNPATRATLATLAHWFGCGRGLVTLVEILVGNLESLSARRRTALDRLEGFARSQDITAFPEVVVAPDFDHGLQTLLQAHSLGPIKPNLVMFGWPSNPERMEPFARHLRVARQLGMSLILVADRGLPPPGAPSRLDIWWRGRANGSLMLLLAYLLTRNWEWARARIRILRVVEDAAGRAPATAALRELVTAARIDADVEVIVSSAPFADALWAHSADAGLVLLGFQVPDDGGRALPIGPGHTALLHGLPTTLFVASTGEADLLA